MHQLGCSGNGPCMWMAVVVLHPCEGVVGRGGSSCGWETGGVPERRVACGGAVSCPGDVGATVVAMLGEVGMTTLFVCICFLEFPQVQWDPRLLSHLQLLYPCGVSSSNNLDSISFARLPSLWRSERNRLDSPPITLAISHRVICSQPCCLYQGRVSSVPLSSSWRTT